MRVFEIKFTHDATGDKVHTVHTSVDYQTSPDGLAEVAARWSHPNNKLLEVRCIAERVTPYQPKRGE